MSHILTRKQMYSFSAVIKSGGTDLIFSAPPIFVYNKQYLNEICFYGSHLHQNGSPLLVNAESNIHKVDEEVHN